MLLLAFVKVLIKAGIPWDRHGHRHRHGHPRRLPREDRREDVSVSGDLRSACHEPDTHDDPRRLVLRLVRHARLSSRGCPLGMRACTRVNVYCIYTIRYRVHVYKNYTIGASLKSMSVSVSVPWNSSYTARYGATRSRFYAKSSAVQWLGAVRRAVP